MRYNAILSLARHYAPDVPTKSGKPARRAATSRGLVREVAYLHRDEVEALARKAAKERTSKSEIIRRALRAYLGVGVED